MQVHVRDGKIEKIYPLDEDFGLCPRAYAIRQIVYAPNRLKYPMKRTAEKGEGLWEKISWDEGLSTIADKLKEIKEKYGPEASAFDFGHRRTGFFKPYYYRFANCFGTPNMSGNTHICTAPRRLAFSYTFGVYGLDPYLDGGMYSDFQNTQCAIIWGTNPLHSSPPKTGKAIIESKERGAKLINIDPKFTFLASIANEYVRIRPGTDGALALGMLNVIINEELYDKDFVRKWTSGFDELRELVKDYPPETVEKMTWVPADQIRKISRMYATAKPACIELGVGVEQQTNSTQAFRAIYILMAVTGNIDVPGGNILYGLSKFVPGPRWLTLDDHKIDAKRLTVKDFPLIGKIGTSHFKIPAPAIWDAILKGKPYPIKAMIIAGANSTLVYANQEVVREALKKLDLLVVIDPYMTPTAELADILLPAASTFEWTYQVKPLDIRGAIRLRRKVIEPLWESRPEPEIIFELARKMGYEKEFPWKNTREAMDWELKHYGLTLKQLEEERYKEFVKRTRERIQVKFRKYEKDGFPTPSQKVEIYSKQFKKYGYNPMPVYKEPAESPISRPDLADRYPLILTTGQHTALYTHSMFRDIPWLREFMQENLLDIHPETARKLDIKDGDFVFVESPRSRIKIRAKITKGIHPKIVSMRHGFVDANCNFLTDNVARDPISASTAMKSSLCRVVRV